MAINQSNYALIGKGVSQYFLYFKTPEMVDALKKEANGAVFETITISNFERATIVLPSKDIRVRFDTGIEPMFAKIANLQTQLTTLRQTLNALLTRLLSGKLAMEA